MTGDFMELPTVAVEGDHALIKVKINGLLHLSIVRKDLFCIQAWHVDDSLWQIEYVSSTGAKVRSDYTNRALWAAILHGVDRVAFSLD